MRLLSEIHVARLISPPAVLLIGVLGGSLAPLPLHAQEPPETRVARLEVNPTALELRVGERRVLEILPLDEAGRLVDDVVFTVWAVGASAWYDVRTSEVEGLVPGEETLIVRVRRAKIGGPGFDDVRSQAKILVSPAPVARIEVQGPTAPLPLYAGTWQRLSARAFSAYQPREDVEIRWESSDPDVVRISDHGVAYAGEPGKARLTASSEGVNESIEVRVVANPIRRLRIEPRLSSASIGDVVHLSAVAEDGDGRPVGDAPVVWSVAGLSAQSSPPHSAYLDDEGAFVAYEPGLFHVNATIGSLSATAEIMATPRPPRRDVTLVAHGVVPNGQSTTDLWIFEGGDGRDYAYTGTYSGNLMYAWDVTEPSSPAITDSLSFDGRRVNDIKINKDATLAVVTSENASNRRNGITVLDISSPAHPVKLVHYTENLTGGIHNTWIEGDLVYAVNYGTQDLHIIDISDPQRPATVGRWGLDKANKWLHDVTIEDGLAYLSYWDDGLIILDVGAGIAGGTPTAPRFVSQYNYQYRLGPETYGNSHHAIRYGDYVFVGDEIFSCFDCLNGPRGYVHVIDVSDVTNPREVAFYQVPEAGVHNMWAEDDKLYVGYYQAGLRVLDISGELRGDLYRQGREIAVFMTEDAEGTRPYSTDTWGAQPYKGRIFASDPASGLWIVEIQPPSGALVP